MKIIEQEEKEEEDSGRGITVWDGAGGAGGDYGPHGDAENKAFYEDLPDLLASVPLSALGISPEQVRLVQMSKINARRNLQ